MTTRRPCSSESEQELSVAAVARRLREVAEGLEAGDLQLGGHAVTPASPVKFEEEYSAETTDEGITFELELELKWSSAAADGQADHANHGSPAAARAAGVAGKFELFKDVGGKFRFRLKAGNGQSSPVARRMRPRPRHRTESSRCEQTRRRAGSTIRPECV